MTISTNENKVIYEGNGTNRIWPFSFPILANEHLKVYIADENGYQSFIEDTCYTVTGIGSKNGGQITYPLEPLEPLPCGHRLVILREIPILQETDLQNQGAYSSEQIEDVFDKHIMIMQQLAEDLERCPKTNISENVRPGDMLEQLDKAVLDCNQALSDTQAALIQAEQAAEEAGAQAQTAANIAVDVQNKAEQFIPLPVGVILQVNRTDTVEGTIDCDGTVYSYNELKSFIDNFILTNKVSYYTFEEYAAELNTHGVCGKPGFDAATNQLKAPYLSDVWTVATLNSPGVYVEESSNTLQAFDVQTNPTPGTSPVNIPGDGTWSDYLLTGEWGADSKPGIRFKNSGNSTKPRSIAYKFVYTVYNATVPVNSVAYTEFMAAVNEIKAMIETQNNILEGVLNGN